METAGDFSDVTELQKYMNFSKFMDLIETNKIFLSKAAGFEDKNEGGLSLEFRLLNDGSAMKLDFAMNHLWPRVKRLTPEEKIEHDRKTIEIQESIEKRINKTVFGNFPNDELGFDDINKQYKEWIDVSCWHANMHESMAMWKIYGESESSVCIVTNLEKIKSSFAPPDGYKMIIAKVEYISHDTDSFKIEHDLAPFMHKSNFYTYEQEVRLIGYNPLCQFKEKRSDFGTKVNLDITNLIQEIRVSPYAPNWFFELVKLVCKKYDLDIPVNRSKIYGSL
ncbi:DUF2971 domain-containing protein [Klebsiella michiganensis]|nr:DUF2971 domain-containing protein [Klebsiella michiganensis]